MKSKQPSHLKHKETIMYDLSKYQDRGRDHQRCLSLNYVEMVAGLTLGPGIDTPRG